MAKVNKGTIKRGTFFQTAHSFNQQSINGWYVSEKLDGMRVRCEGGRLITMLEKELHVPDEWIEQVPNGLILDGELTIPGESRQAMLAVVKDHIPDRAEWRKVRFNVFDIINREAYRYNYETIAQLRSNVVVPVHQERLPFKQVDAVERLRTFTADIINRGGEGAIVRDPMARYSVGKQHHILKVKPRQDAEARIVGFKSGQGKYFGMIGSICCKLVDKVPIYFDISGLTDEERKFADEAGTRWAQANPSAVVPDSVRAEYFTRGAIITFKYRGKTRDGVPMEAQYWRPRDEDE